MQTVRKALIPAAGLGTRFLPATKAIPKEMLPIVDKPTIQYVVEEAVQSGLQDIIFVTSQGKEAIEDHFDYSYELDHVLRQQGKEELWNLVNELAGLITVSSVRQKKPLGLGHAVLVAESLVGDEPFGVFLGDDIIAHERPCMRQLLDVFEEKQASVLAVLEVPREAVGRYGIVAAEKVDQDNPRLLRVKALVEKPKPEDAPSNLAIIGRYVLTPRIFPLLRATPPGALGEIQLTDGIQKLVQEEPVFAYRFEGSRYDAGNKLEFLIATVEFALKRADVGEDFRRYLKGLKLEG